MLERVLTPDQESLLSQERGALRELQEALVRAGAADEDLAALEESIRQLDRLFLLVVVGEFNSGKSTFINALLGRPLLEEGVTPTTSRIYSIGFGEEVRREMGTDGIEEIGAPVEILRQIQIVDTPGTNALEREHEALTQRFVPRADLVLFVTSVDRPFTESERSFIESIREWGKKIVLVLNKIDFLETDDDLREIEDFIRRSSERILGFVPEVFPISARQALKAKEASDDPSLNAGSRFSDLEAFLSRTLDEKERVRLKLLNPLGVGERLVEGSLTRQESRLGLLKDDFEALEEIALQLDLYRKDMQSEFRFRLADVDNELYAFEQRGRDFFDETFRLARALDLLNKERVKAEFERKVIAETPHRIEGKTEEIIDWLVEAELRQWQTVSRHLSERRKKHPDRLLGPIGDFDYSRDQLLGTVGRAAEETIQSFDQRAEATRLADSVRTAVAGTVLVEAGAIGLGTVFSILATSQLADFTGLLAASTLAIVGFFILPARRRKAKNELTDKILALRRRLMDILTTEFDREVERSVHRIEEAVGPYTRFVRAEREKLEGLRGALLGSKEALQTIRAKVEALGP
jgi:small GTP-binding protein